MKVDDAIMLDLYGFVSETNSTNIFMIKNNIIYTPFPKACLPGITRQLIIELCINNNLTLIERDISITEFYNADVVFTSGTMSELSRVKEIDKRKLNIKNHLFKKIKHYFKELTKNEKYLYDFKKSI